MMLVQKQPALLALTSPALHSHRRHPSAPAVVVQATRTPGLLSLSKPAAKQTPTRPLPSQQRQFVKATPKPKQVVRAHPLNSPAATPSPQPRGRTHAKQPKQSNRSASHSSVRGKHGRQPSPPIPASDPSQPPSQAEDNCINSTNHFDPFLVPTTSPVLSPSPSGKLARRRQQMNKQSISMPIPVPAIRTTNPISIARSDPLPRFRPVQKRSAAVEKFPVCDDSSENGESDELLTPPATPVRHFGSANYFGQFPNSSPSNKPSRRHYRTPSEGVFLFSLDDDLSSDSLPTILFPTMKHSLTAPTSSMMTPDRPTIPRGRSASPSGDNQHGHKLYASSTFMNSPSPDELPQL